MLDRNRRAWVCKLAEGRANTDRRVLSRSDHQPKAGDIVITRINCHPAVRYMIGRLDQQPQLSCDSRAKALTIARTFARHHPVDIWERNAGRFTSVAPRGLGER